MSSTIKVQKICQYCGIEFTARTTVTKYCSHTCNSRAYKAQKRVAKVNTTHSETAQIKTLPIEKLKAKEFLTVRDVSVLLGCSVRSVYRFIDNGTLKAVNLNQRMTRVKRSDIDNLLK